MNTLVIEILACLFAAAFLSLFIGWAIRSALASKEIQAANAAWETKQSELELRYKQDTEQLEEQNELLDKQNKQLETRNENLSESLRENEIGVHKARADAIELNRQQADTQERLQRIIAQKDEELKMIREGSAPAIGAVSNSDTQPIVDETTEAKIATLSAKREAWEAERQRLINNIGDDQATVALDPSDIPSEPFDKTVRVQPDYVDELRKKVTSNNTQHDIESDQTMALDDDETIAMDNNLFNRNDQQSPKNNKPIPGGSPTDLPGDNDK